jgi:DNA-binding MarR family transcriptional regulator
VTEDTIGTQGCLSFLVRHAWLSMRTVVAEALAAHGLSVAQFATLMKLDEQPGITVADLARAMSSARQSANQLLAGMERSGLIERRPHPRDRRAQQTFITDAGRERLRAAIPAVQEVEAVLQEGFSAHEREVARTWLLRMAGAATSSEEEIPTV